MIRRVCGRLGYYLTSAWVMLLMLPAYAQPTGGGASTIKTECSEYSGITHRAAGCLRLTIDSAAEKFFNEFGATLASAIAAFLTLGVIIYGIMLAMGMVEKIGRDTFIFLMKIAAIITFTANSALIYNTVTDAMDGAMLAVVTYTPPSSAMLDGETQVDQTVCMNQTLEEIRNAPTDQPIVAPWLGMDCLLDTVIGIKRPTDTTKPAPLVDGKWFNEKYDNATDAKSNQGMSRGLLFFFFSGMQTSIVGAVLAAIGLFFVAGVLGLVIRAFFVYIMGYMGIAFLVIISPLIIPLILLPQTKQYFDKWSKLLISFALQPVLMVVFVIFAMTAIDLAVFTGKYSVTYRIAGEASRQARFDLNRYLTDFRNENGVRNPNPALPAPKDAGPIIPRENKNLFQIKGETGVGADPTTGKVTDIGKTSTISRDFGGVARNLLFTDCKGSVLDPIRAKAETARTQDEKNKWTYCNSYYSISAQWYKIDWYMMAKAREQEGNIPIQLADGTVPGTDEEGRKRVSQMMANEVIGALFFCAIIVYLLNGLVQIVPRVAHDLVGDMGQTPNIAGMGGSGGFMSGIGGNIAKGMGLKR